MKIFNLSDKEEGKKFETKLMYLKKNSQWKQIIKFLEPYVDKYPDVYYINCEICGAYESVGDSKALIYIQKAYEFEPNDYYVLSHYSFALYLNDRYNEAITICNRIKADGLQKIIDNEHSEGVKWSKSIYIDNFYVLAICLLELEDYKNALDTINEHLKCRRRGIYSGFNKRHVLKTKEEIVKLLGTDGETHRSIINKNI